MDLDILDHTMLDLVEEEEEEVEEAEEADLFPVPFPVTSVAAAARSCLPRWRASIEKRNLIAHSKA